MPFLCSFFNKEYVFLDICYVIYYFIIVLEDIPHLVCLYIFNISVLLIIAIIWRIFSSLTFLIFMFFPFFYIFCYCYIIFKTKGLKCINVNVTRNMTVIIPIINWFIIHLLKYHLESIFWNPLLNFVLVELCM